MGSSPEMERFEVSNDDYEASMNPLGRRFRQSRKKTIYGIFASDSDSEDEKTGFSGRESIKKRKGANYTAPITFVSGGLKPGNRPPNEPKDPIAEVISDEEDDKKFLDKLNRHDSDSGSSEGDRPTKEKAVFRRPLPTFGAGRRAAMNSLTNNKSGFGAWERHTKGIGMKLLEQMGYEHGKGLGSEGQGITTPVQAAPRADAKAAVGFFGVETAQAPRRGNETLTITQDTKTDGLPRYKKKGTKSSTISYDLKTTDEILANFASHANVGTTKQHSIFLKDSEMSKVKVIDMTSKEQRVYSGYEAALSRTARKSKRPDGGVCSDEEGVGPDAEQRRLEKRREGLLFDCPALRYNLSLMLRSDEDEIRKLDRNQRFAEDRCVGIEHEIERLAELVKVESVEVDRLRIALEMISRFEELFGSASRKPSSDPRTLRVESDACQFMLELRQKCNGMPELPLLMAAMAKPMLEAAVAKWKPLCDPVSCMELFAEWCELFHNPSAFEMILKTSWLKVLRRSIINDWEPRECEKLLSLLESWKPLLPIHLLDQDILQQLVLPKLKPALFLGSVNAFLADALPTQACVENWNPLTDTVPIHTWLQPWLPWFGGTERLTEVHDIVLRKLGSCLATWHPSDGSAHSVLMPWRSVLSVGQISGFLARYVVPKLEVTLKTFKLNPAAQQMEPWQWIMRWCDLVGPTVLVNMLEHHFWPRWITVLSDWLAQGVQARHRSDQTAASQVFQEVGRWYAGWKGQLPPECMEYASVKDALTKALAMMERAMRGLPPQEPDAVPKPGSTSVNGPAAHPLLLPQQQRSANGPGAVGVPLTAGGPPVTLRKQVEQVAAQRGLVFHPVANRQVEGQQVYRLETVLVFFDRNVSYVHHSADNVWHPVGFAELLSRAEQQGTAMG